MLDLDIHFHPDNDFANYVNYKTGKRIMSNENAALYNRLMDEAFEVFDDEDEMYEIAYHLLNEKLTNTKNNKRK